MDADQREAAKNLFLAFLVLVFELGGGVTGILGLLVALESTGYPMDATISGWSTLLALVAAILGALMLGMFAGVAVLCLVLRLFFGWLVTAEEAEAILVAPPYVPLISPVLRRIFRWVYGLPLG